MTNTSEITVAICTFNRSAHLRDTLACLAHQVADFSDFEVLVVNNNCTDDTTETIKEAQESYPTLRLRTVLEQNQGLSHARNRALFDANGTYVLFIDDDVYLDDDFIQNWIHFVGKGEVKAAGGPISVHFDDGKPDWFPMVLAQMLGRHKAQKSGYVYPKGAFPHGGNMLFRKDVALQIGFNTSIGRAGNQLSAGEEKDFFRRLQAENVRILHNPNSPLKHRIGNERLTKDYFIRQARGIGHGDALSGVSPKGWYVGQLAKLCVSVIISGGYLLLLQPAKARMLIQFRLEVFRGFRTASNGRTAKASIRAKTAITAKPSITEASKSADAAITAKPSITEASKSAETAITAKPSITEASKSADATKTASNAETAKSVKQTETTTSTRSANNAIKAETTKSTNVIETDISPKSSTGKS